MSKESDLKEVEEQIAKGEQNAAAFEAETKALISRFERERKERDESRVETDTVLGKAYVNGCDGGLFFEVSRHDRTETYSGQTETSVKYELEVGCGSYGLYSTTKFPLAHRSTIVKLQKLLALALADYDLQLLKEGSRGAYDYMGGGYGDEVTDENHKTIEVPGFPPTTETYKSSGEVETLADGAGSDDSTADEAGDYNACPTENPVKE